MTLKEVAATGKSVAGVAHNAITSFRSAIGLATIALAGISAIGVAKAVSPSAVADNADGFILNETLKTSLAKSRQDNEVLKRQKKLQEYINNQRLPHDKFI